MFFFVFLFLFQFIQFYLFQSLKQIFKGDFRLLLFIKTLVVILYKGPMHEQEGGDRQRRASQLTLILFIHFKRQQKNKKKVCFLGSQPRPPSGFTSIIIFIFNFFYSDKYTPPQRYLTNPFLIHYCIKKNLLSLFIPPLFMYILYQHHNKILLHVKYHLTTVMNKF